MTACGGFFGKAVQKPWPFLRNLGRTSLECSGSVSDSPPCLPLPAAVRKYSHGRAKRGKRDLVTKAAPRFALLSEKAAIPIVKDVPPATGTLPPWLPSPPSTIHRSVRKRRKNIAAPPDGRFQHSAGPLCFSFLLNRIPRHCNAGQRQQMWTVIWDGSGREERERAVGNWVPYVVALAGTEIETCGKRTRIERARERGREGFPSHPGIHITANSRLRLSE